MSHRIAILTPDPADEGYLTRGRDVFADKSARLEAAGFRVEDRSWADGADLDAFDLVLPLLVWGYHRALPQWREATAGWEKRGVRLQNPPTVLRWNADKPISPASPRPGRRSFRRFMSTGSTRPTSKPRPRGSAPAG